jgi:hypothetical protein
MAALLVVKHDVGDFDTWLEGYTAFAPLQEKLGVRDKSVHQLPGQPNTVLVLHTFDSVDAANAFVSAPELGEAMQKAGVVGEPRIEIYATR